MSARCRIVCLLSVLLLCASAGRAGETRLEQRVYAVSDLVVPADDAAPAMREDRLIKLITRTIAPRSWSAKGGPGTIDYFPQTTSLVVNQTPDVQERIADLLAALRRAEEEEKHSIKPVYGKTTICPCGGKEDGRTPIQPPVREGEMVQGDEPSEARILRALPRAVRVPGICEESRDNIQIVTERLVDKIDPPRFFPLVGPAQLHHCHWKCTVYYNDTIACTYPFTFRYTRVCSHVVYVDSDHLHIVPEAEWKGR